MQDEPIGTRYFRMTSEYRRCFVYFMVGLFFVAIISYWVVNYIQNLGATAPTSLYIFPIAISLSMLIPLSWRIRANDRGLSRRRFFRWDHWSWGDFAGGRVVKYQASAMRDSSRPFWRRNLNLGLLDGGDFKMVMALINRHYKIPPSPEISDELKLKYWFRKKLILNRKGIQVIEKGEKQDYGWDNVKRVRFIRRDPESRFFSSLELSLSNREIELTTLGKTPKWNGATVEEVNDFFLAYTAEEHIVIDIAYETPIQTQDIEKQLKIARKFLRERNYIMVMGILVTVAMLLGCLFKESMHFSKQEEDAPCIFLLLMTVMVIGVWFTQKEKKKSITELNQLLAERKNSGSSSAI